MVVVIVALVVVVLVVALVVLVMCRRAPTLFYIVGIPSAVFMRIGHTSLTAVHTICLSV